MINSPEGFFNTSRIFLTMTTTHQPHQPLILSMVYHKHHCVGKTEGPIQYILYSHPRVKVAEWGEPSFSSTKQWEKDIDGLSNRWKRNEVLVKLIQNISGSQDYLPMIFPLPSCKLENPPFSSMKKSQLWKSSILMGDFTLPYLIAWRHMRHIYYIPIHIPIISYLSLIWHPNYPIAGW